MDNKQEQRVAKLIVEQKIIESVKSRPAIYNISHPDLRNSVVIENNWQGVFDGREQQNILHNPAACAELWKNIRSQYLTFKRKVKGKSGKKGGRRPSFSHELSMQYFDDQLDEDEETIGNVDLSDTNDDDDGTTTATANVLHVHISKDETGQQHVNIVSPASLISPGSASNSSIFSESDTSSSTRSRTSRSHKGGGGPSAKTAKSFDDRLIDCLTTG